MKTVNERFVDKVRKTGDCWLWTGSKSGSGYGQFWNGQRTIPSHWFWLETEKLEKLRIKGNEACHTCDNKLCVRPSHVFIGTRSDNMRDCVSKGRLRPRNGCLAMLKVRKVHIGQNNHQCKLTEYGALQAKNCSRKRGAATALAKKLGVSLTVVCDIRDGKRWSHLK